MQNALGSFSKAELIALLERRAAHYDHTLEEKEVTIERSLPTYNLLGKWISSNMSKVLPQSPTGIAFRYAFKRWDELGDYMYDGRLHIDNSPVENAISHEGAQRAAVMFIFADQCKRLNIDPHRWLTNVFENIFNTKPSQYYTLLPQKYPVGNS